MQVSDNTQIQNISQFETLLSGQDFGRVSSLLNAPVVDMDSLLPALDNLITLVATVSNTIIPALRSNLSLSQPTRDMADMRKSHAALSGLRSAMRLVRGCIALAGAPAEYVSRLGDIVKELEDIVEDIELFSGDITLGDMAKAAEPSLAKLWTDQNEESAWENL